MKKATAFLLILSVCLVFAVVPTWAWVTTRDRATNDFTIADLGGNIEEHDYTPPPNGQLRRETPHPKKVSVKNTTDQRAFIRVILLPQVIDTRGNLLEDKTALQLGLILSEPSDADPLWIDGEDGYYYYAKAMEPGQETELLMDEVTVTNAAGEEYEGAKVDVFAAAEFCSVSKSLPHRIAWWAGNAPTGGRLQEIDQLLKDAV